jgi:hypothetical protein
MISAISNLLRDKLREIDPIRFGAFNKLLSNVLPRAQDIVRLFPEFTRHDPSHNESLERIAAEIVTAEALTGMSGSDLLALLSVLWVHDAGMSPGATIEAREKSSAQYIEQLQRYRRLGLPDNECWRDYVRDRHPSFCDGVLRESLPTGMIADDEMRWIARIAESHGKAELHDRSLWPKEVSVGPNQHMHPTAIAVVLRLADILHFDCERAPAFLMEHRRIENSISLQHWRAHQACSGYVIDSDGICHFDGITTDDEAYWYAREFVDQVDRELRYCLFKVLPTLDPPFRNCLRFRRVDFRISAEGFDASHPVRIRVDPAPMLSSLLQDALYAGKPVWLRELLQNAFDALRDRSALGYVGDMGVTVSADTTVGTVEVRDDGVGMRRHVVEAFLLTAGASFWTSAEYRGARESIVGHVGRFGIGFLSVFGVADEVIVETRDHGESSGWLFCIRSLDRTVRTEEVADTPVGTRIRLKLKDPVGVLGDLDEHFVATVASPEYRCSLVVDRKPVRVVDPGPQVISAPRSSPPGGRASYYVDSRSQVGLDVRVGYPKLRIDCLGVSVATLGRFAGGTDNGSDPSSVHYGGIRYPALHLDRSWGFRSLPSCCNVQVVASPQRYALEMNLARERFVAGNGVAKLFLDVASVVDQVLAADLKATLANVSDEWVRSTVTAMYIEAGLGSFAGDVGGPGHYVGQIRSMWDLTLQDPWPALNALFREEVRFAVIEQGCATPRRITAGELVQSGRPVFGIGLLGPGRVSNAALRTIWNLYPTAMIIVVNPCAETSLLTLRKWATEEIFVPILEHGRSAYGLRLSEEFRPFEFKRRKRDDLGIPAAWGPASVAVLDYRDWMMEYGSHSGSSTIWAVLNLANARVAELLRRLVEASDKSEMTSAMHGAVKSLRGAISIGSNNKYHRDACKRTIGALNLLSTAAGCPDQVRFKLGDAPSYFGGGTVKPIGAKALSEVAARALFERQAQERPWLTWS